ncbi:MAG: Na+/H+ antiporter subunit E [Thermodesulfovibrionales bacterium]|nr:Na+/H+ antiporter subunit E [Thermodesulfovibrionales bacterium]
MRYIVTFLILFLNWVIWSGMFDAFHLSLGIISCAIVTYTTHDILFTREKFSSAYLVEAVRFIKYIPWLLWQIILSNIHVAYLVLHPKMPIEPSLISFKTSLKKDISLVTFANSITLTPGTITLDIQAGKYYIVHCISRKVADDLLTGDMERRVAHIFMED